MARAVFPFIAGICVYFLLDWNRSPPEIDPVPVFSNAGRIQKISVKDGTFSTVTTVVTSRGMYQVSGAVSAGIGDQVRKKFQYFGGAKEYTETSLCLDSKVKTDCYKLK